MNRSIVICLSVLSFLMTGACASLDNSIRDAGYIPLKTPSTIQPIGVVVALDDSRSEWWPFGDPRKIDIGTQVCSQMDSIGDGAKIDLGDAETLSVRQEIAQNYELSASTIDEINAKIGLNYVREITYTLSDVKVYVLPDSEILASLIGRDEKCTIAVDDRKKRREDLVMVNSAIRATTKYRIVTNPTVQLNVEASEKALETLSAKLGIKIDKLETVITRSGENLFIGVKVNKHLYETPSETN